MHDTDWPGTAGLPDDWTADAKVQFDPDDPSKTIPLSWAQDYLQREYRRNPPQFGKRLGEVVSDWSNHKIGSE